MKAQARSNEKISYRKPPWPRHIFRIPFTTMTSVNNSTGFQATIYHWQFLACGKKNANLFSAKHTKKGNRAEGYNSSENNGEIKPKEMPRTPLLPRIFRGKNTFLALIGKLAVQ